MAAEEEGGRRWGLSGRMPGDLCVIGIFKIALYAPCPLSQISYRGVGCVCVFFLVIVAALVAGEQHGAGGAPARSVLSPLGKESHRHLLQVFSFDGLISSFWATWKNANASCSVFTPSKF